MIQSDIVQDTELNEEEKSPYHKYVCVLYFIIDVLGTRLVLPKLQKAAFQTIHHIIQHPIPI